MSGNAELLESMKMFSQGLKDAAIGNGISAAQEELDQLNQSQLGEMERRSAQQQVANRLAMTMAGAGARPEQMSAAIGAVAPTKLNSPEDFFAAAVSAKDPKAREVLTAGGRWMQENINAPAVEQEERQFSQKKELQGMQDASQIKQIGLQGDENRKTGQQKYGFDVSLKRMDLASAEKIAAMKSTTTLNDKQSKALDNAGKAFRGTSGAQKYLQMAENAKNIKEILASENPVGDQAVVNFLVKASGDVGALTESDKAPFKSSQAITERLAQIKEQYVTGKLTPENRKYLNDLADTFEKAANRSTSTMAKRISQTTAKIHGLNDNDVYNIIYPDNPEAMTPVEKTATGQSGSGTAPVATPPPTLPGGVPITPQMQERARSFMGGRSGSSIPRKKGI